MSEILDLHCLLRSAPPGVAAHLRDLKSKHDEAVITTALLRALGAQTTPAVVLPTWLAIAREPESLKAVLLQELSRFGRLQAIRYIGKWLKSNEEDSNRIWLALGGVPGIVDLLKGMSVDEATHMLHAIGSSCKPHHTQRETRVTDLFKVLCSNTILASTFEQNENLNMDGRPLLYLYLDLLPSCTSECVKTVVEQKPDLIKEWRHAHYLLRSHTSLMQEFYRNDMGTRLPFLSKLCVNEPPLPGAEPGFSSAMSFKWSLLQHYIDTGSQGIESQAPSIDLAQGLFRVALSKKAPRPWLEQIASTSIRFYEKYQQFKINLGPDESPMLERIIRWWSQAQKDGSSSAQHTAYEAWLTRIFTLIKPTNPRDIIDEPLLKHANCVHRYALLCLISTTYLDFDIETDECLKRHSFKKELFDMLQPEHAILLLERLINARPKVDFILPENHVVSISNADPLGIRTVTLVLLAQLKGDNEQSSRLIVERMDAQKQRASMARDQYERARLATSVAQYAALSRSLILLDDVSQWMGRYTRDSLAIGSLLSFQGIASATNHATLSVISCRAHDQNSHTTVNRITKDVSFANSILRRVCRLVLDFRREPHYNTTYVDVIQGLVANVVRHRLTCARDFQKRCSFSDEELNTAVLKDTFDVYSEMVHTALKLGLEDNRVERLFFAPHRLTEQLSLSKACLKFVDHVAEFLDDLWHKRRTREHSALLEIPKPFPKGLPIQKMVSGYPYDAGWRTDDSPFIMSRAKSIALMKADVAMGPFPSDEMQPHIGVFREDLHYAVMVYVLEAESSAKQITRLEEVWRHWMVVLCEHSTMDRSDAATWLRTALINDRCKPHLEKALHSFDPQRQTYSHYPSLPYPPRDQQILEWNPAEQEPKQSGQKYSLAAIDCLIHAATPNLTIDWSQLSERKINRTAPQFWHLQRLGDPLYKVAGNLAEGVITTALSCLDGQVASQKSLLGTSFPSNAWTRYPALYLDSEFLDRKKSSTPQHSLSALIGFRFRAPPALLEALISKFIDAIKTPPEDLEARASLESTCFKMIKLFARENQPQLAARFILNIVLEHPQSSAWHRQLLTARYLERLSANQARTFVDDFASEILLRWKAQAKRPTPSSEGLKDSVSPTIKVTTVKQLAEILKDADFVPADFGVRILSSLFHQASHIDVRAATLDAIIELMHTSHDNEALMTQIMTFFESTVPIIGAFNERHPFSEEQWQEAELTLTIPPPFSENSVDNQPLSTKFATDTRLPENFERQFFDTVLFPAMELSKRNKERWMRIVLKKYAGAERLAATFAYPMDFQSFSSILIKYRAYLPVEYYETWHGLFRENLDPSPDYKYMRDLFQNETEPEHSSVRLYWWTNFFSGEFSMMSAGLERYTSSNVLSLEWQETKRTDGRGITVEQVQRWWLEEATVVLEKRSTPRMERMQESLLPGISPRSSLHNAHSDHRENRAHARDWLANARPVLQQFANMVEQKRSTTTWQSEINRQPSFLPSSLRLDICLLPFPFLILGGTSEERCLIFAQGIFQAVKRVPDSLRQRVFMPMEALWKSILNCSADDDDVNRTICYLGDIERLDNGQISAALLFCLEMCEELLSQWKGDLKGSVWNLAQDTVKKWATSEIEQVRNLGQLVQERFRTTSPGLFRQSGITTRMRVGRN